MNKFQSMMNMQNDLNKIIGRDTLNDPNKEKWFFDYAQALQDEINELRNCINWKWWIKESKENEQYTIILNEKNAKIELIDCFHFIMSLSLILDLDYEFEKDGINSLDRAKKQYDNDKINLGKDLFVITEILTSLVYQIKSSTNWRNKERDFKNITITYKDKSKELVRDVINLLFLVAVILDMSIDDIFKIYKLKHEKNIIRQHENYSILEKTEDDNKEIEKQI